MTIRLNRLAFVALLALLVFTTTASAQSSGRAELRAEIKALHDQLKQKAAQFVAPSPKDIKKYSQFLGQPHTGICRLLPRETYDGMLPIRGGGSYYSFTDPSNEYGSTSQIGLEQGLFHSTLMGADIGVMISLGDAPLENLEAEQDGVQYLAGIVAPTREPEARDWQKRAGGGFEAEGFKYKSTLPAAVDSTYAVRSIQFNRADVVVAFRVVSQDEDGSVVLLWKILKRFPTPQLWAEQARPQ